ncbi:phosphoglycerate dehydrogenase-like enzyme [Frondihabitans sp. PhB188]|uniref:D-isomer specific 2-hydroxyacid dehydrogenase family protein n=1 Tax=Frondihabitans sp. PhB188 TaxID=2485200 RepID=UPI000F479D67|nr:D-isomer specific 2-hydroxyacid dehydrogenase family protein [Frondihabitans sp. PhB188]ROQ41172.1 phosphoglycerate dehydrogenase-like enzyme [Frondihabitans sp. PhB188]
MTSSSAARGHRAVLTPSPVVPDERRPTPGPIAVGPSVEQHVVDAVEAGGGTLGPIDDETRGLMWLSHKAIDELDEVLTTHPNIEWVQLPMAGVDMFAPIMKKYADSPRPLWTSAKGAYSEPVAEHAVALTLALLRVFPERVRASSWATVPKGISLYGLNVVIVGAGGIGLEIMRLLEPFDTSITVVRRSTSPVPGAARTVAASSLDEVLPDADVVIVAAAMTDDTAKMFGASQFDLMKDTAVLVNIARGGLVDTDALVEALRAESLWGAGLDVTDPEPLPDGHPLWTEPRALITPHQADTPEMTAPLLAERIRHNVAALSGDGEFIGVVDPAAGY